MGDELILPVPYFDGVDIADLLAPEIGQQLFFNKEFFGFHRRWLQTVPHIFHVIFHQRGKEDIGSDILLIQKAALIFFRFALRFESPLAYMFFLAGSVCVIEVGVPEGFAAL